MTKIGTWHQHPQFPELIMTSGHKRVARFDVPKDAEAFMTLLTLLKEITPEDVRKVRGCRLHVADRLEEILKCLT